MLGRSADLPSTPGRPAIAHHHRLPRGRSLRRRRPKPVVAALVAAGRRAVCDLADAVYSWALAREAGTTCRHSITDRCQLPDTTGGGRLH